MSNSSIDWAVFFAVIAILVALIPITWPSVQRWATKMCVYYKVTTDVRRHTSGLIPWYTHIRLALMWMPIEYIRLLMKPHHRIAFEKLVEAVMEEKSQSTELDEYAPDPDGNPLYIEIAAYLHIHERWRIRRLQYRRHRGVRCSGGCGTKYGKRRKDHDFSGGGGIDLSGGWFCHSLEKNALDERCDPKATGDHYCGMCTKERAARQADETAGEDLETPAPHDDDLAPRP